MQKGKVRNANVARETIRAVEAMGVSDSVRTKIYEGNARRLLHL